MSDPVSPSSDRAALRRSLLRQPLPTVPGAAAPQGGCCAPAATAPRAGCCAPSAATAGSCCGGAAATRRFDYLLWGSLALFLVGVAVHLTGMGGPPWLQTFGHSCYELIMRSWWGVLAGIVAVAVIGRFPGELVAALLGRGGSISGLFRAVAAGVLLDLCNHGILLVGMGLYRRGLSLGQTLAFLIASPWNSLSLTLILAALIGWPWMLLFILLSMVVALLTGWITNRLVAAGKIPPNPNAIDLPAGYRIAPAIHGVLRSLRPSRHNYLNLAREGLLGSRMVLRWILFGFVLTGIIRAGVPTDTFMQFFGPTLTGLGLTLLATTAIEVCSEGSSPIAADLLTRAHAPGNAFVFLMAGAATDYTEIVSLRQTTRSWRASLALPLISTPQVLLIGWLIHQLSQA